MRERPTAEAYCLEIRPRLVGALSLYTGDVQLAEDVAQESLARVWDRWDDVRAMRSADAWTFRVAFNLAHSWVRRRRARRAREQRAGVPGAVAVDGDVAEGLAVRAAVAELPRRQKQALVLRYFEDLSVADTAVAMACAQGTVKALTSQAIARLRQDPRLPQLDDVEVTTDAS